MTRVPGLGFRLYASTAEANRRAIMEHMPPARGGVFLDVGCASGIETMRVAAHVGAGRILGLELGDDFVTAARERGVEVEKADLGEPWPLEDASIDVLHANQVVEHLPRTDVFFSEIRRVLRPGGYAIVSTNNLSSWHNIAALTLGLQPLPAHVSDRFEVGNPAALPHDDYGEGVHRHLRLFTARALAELAERHGLRVEVRAVSGFYPFGPRVARTLARAMPLYAAYLVQRYVVA
jgi:SAM-dependent methyltransferase